MKISKTCAKCYGQAMEDAINIIKDRIKETDRGEEELLDVLEELVYKIDQENVKHNN